MKVESIENLIRVVVVCRSEEESKALGNFIIRTNALGCDTSTNGSATPPESKVPHPVIPLVKPKVESVPAKKEKRHYKKRKAEEPEPEKKEDIKPAGDGWKNRSKKQIKQHENLEKALELVRNGKTVREAAMKVWGSCKIGQAYGKLKAEEQKREGADNAHPSSRNKPPSASNDALESKIIEYLNDGPAKPMQIRKFIGASESVVDQALQDLRFAGKVVRESGKYMLKGWEPKEEPDEPEDDDDNEAPESILHPGNGEPEEKPKHFGRPKKSEKRETTRSDSFKHLADFCRTHMGDKTGFSLSQLQEALEEKKVPDYMIAQYTSGICDFGSTIVKDLWHDENLKISTFRGKDNEKMLMVEDAA